MKKEHQFFYVFFLVFCLYIFAVYDIGFNGADEPIYYAYTASVVEDGDLNAINEVSPQFDQFTVSKNI